MTWVVVPCLLEGRDQLDARFPNRDKSSEGTIGDTAHQTSPSSHNPDETGKPEFDDHDGVDEVRAWDADKDLRDPSGIAMEVVVQHLIEELRAGQLWWIRYIIYNKRIWHRRTNFVTQTYTGSNPHTDHVHFNSDFTQAADTAKGTNWHLSDIGKPPVVVVSTDAPLVIDGDLGPKTVAKWQKIMGTTVDGKISSPSKLVKAVQRRLNATVGAGLKVDGLGIAQNNQQTHTVEALQRYLKTPTDGRISLKKSAVVMALQRRLNQNFF